MALLPMLFQLPQQAMRSTYNTVEVSLLLIIQLLDRPKWTREEKNWARVCEDLLATDTKWRFRLESRLLSLSPTVCYIYVCPYDATFLLGTRDSVPIEHRSTLSQGVASASSNVCHSLAVPAIRQCWKHLQHPWTAWNSAPWGHCPKEQSWLVWTDL